MSNNASHILSTLATKIDKTPTCWNWVGPSTRGYGRITFEGRPEYVHRLVFKAVYGDIPKGYFVCHKCDNTKCCRPEHLFLGTPADNVQDMIKKGRGKHTKGRHHHNAKLTEDQVDEIRQAVYFRIKNKELAKKFGVAKQLISGIRNYRYWKHLPRPEPPTKKQYG